MLNVHEKTMANTVNTYQVLTVSSSFCIKTWYSYVLREMKNKHLSEMFKLPSNQPNSVCIDLCFYLKKNDSLP